MTSRSKNALLSVAQMYRCDALAIEGGISGIELMENAGRAITREILTRFNPRKVLILCGPGNNGGDGFVVGRLLREAGINVDLMLLGSAQNLKGDAKANAARWTHPVIEMSTENLVPADLIVDAIFGAGLSRPIEGRLADVLAQVQAMDAPILAVDVPSGIDGDTGQTMGSSLKADLTVTFVRGKTGHYLYPARDLCGELIVSDIAIKDATVERVDPLVWVNSPELWEGDFPWPKPTGHKFDRGHGVIISGPHMTGATRLAAVCARRVGAGLLTISAHGTASLIHRQADPGNIVSGVRLEDHLQDPRKNAYLIGPGLGVGADETQSLQKLLAADCNLVIDADALTVLGEQGQRDFHVRKGQTLLTPHEGEFQRMFADISGSKLQRARKAAEISGATVIIKGPDTVVAHPDGRAVINTTGSPWLATAGSGDCLSGICLGLLAQGVEVFKAAQMAVWIHGRAGETVGPGLIAEDLVDQIAQVLKNLHKD